MHGCAWVNISRQEHRCISLIRHMYALAWQRLDETIDAIESLIIAPFMSCISLTSQVLHLQQVSNILSGTNDQHQ